MAVLSGTRHDPLRGFKYRVTITPPPGIGGTPIEAGFQRISGLREEIEVVEYRNGDEQGGARKLPGMVSYDNLVMERGQLMESAPDAEKLMAWKDLVQSALKDGADDEESIRGSILIHVFNRPVTPSASATAVMYYERLQCWPTVYEHSDLSGTDSDVLVERVEFACEGGGVGLGMQ